MKNLFTSQIPKSLFAINRIGLLPALLFFLNFASIAQSKCGSIIKGTPFQSDYLTTAGTLADRDIVAKNKTLTYEITPPTGYSNTDFAAAWVLSGMTVKTLHGITVSSQNYSMVPPSSASNAKISFTPDAALEDSTVIFSINLKSFNKPQCDSTLKRFILVGAGSTGDGNNKIKESSETSLYPNPNSGNFTIRVKCLQPDISIMVSNIVGEVIENIDTYPVQSGFLINLHQPKGFYLVKIINGEDVYVKRVFIQ